MQFASRSGLAAIAVAAVLAVGGPAPAQESPVLLTVTGAVENANRGAFDPEKDKLFAFNDVSFDEAVEFDLEALRKLPQVTVKADFPMGAAVQEFTGPRLEDLLQAAGASGNKVVVEALDGYAVEWPLAEMIDKGAVVALERNGEPLGIGGLGPAQIVFPRAERPDLAEMNDDGWVWQIYHIRVE
jgi:hypothetical protein